MNESIMSLLGPILTAVIAIGVVIFILISGYIKAPPDTAFLVSGVRKKPRILVGRAGLKVPFFERVDKLSLGTIQIDVKTSSAVPTMEYINIFVDSNVNVRVGQSDEMIALAAQNFLNIDRETIGQKVRDLLEGNVREIVGQMKLTDMVSDRKAFSEKVQENAVPDLARFGLELVSFNVQNFRDDNDVITNLGIDNVEQIRKQAAIAKSDAKKEIAIAEAKNQKEANDVKMQAAEEIAKRNNEVEIKQAQLKKEADTQKAIADAAKDIEGEKQRELRDVASINADIAKAEREAELKQKNIELEEYQLTAVVRKKADADKYAAEQKAEAEKITRQNRADAERYEQERQAEAEKFATEQQAEAMRVQAEKEAEAIRIKAEADKAKELARAEGIAAVGRAEAAAIREKAEAQKLMGEASVLEMTLKALPEMMAAAAAPLSNVDNMVIYGSDGGSKMVSDVMQSTHQVVEAMKASGIDLPALLSGFAGAKMGSQSAE